VHSSSALGGFPANTNQTLCWPGTRELLKGLSHLTGSGILRILREGFWSTEYKQHYNVERYHSTLGMTPAQRTRQARAQAGMAQKGGKERL